MKKFLSRKFIVFVINTISILLLTYFQRVEGSFSVIAILINGFIYVFVEGVIDLSNLKFIKLNNFEIKTRK